MVYIPEEVFILTPRRLNHSAKVTTKKEITRIQVPSANTVGSFVGNRSWPQM
jgi:hypothetical protein